MVTSVKKMVCFQYFKEMELPVYIKYDDALLPIELKQILLDHNFSQLDEKQTLAIEEHVEKTPNAKLLNIEIASPILSSQILSYSETDTYGKESVTPKDGYNIYRYRGGCVMLYSFNSSEWKMGVLESFSSTTDLMTFRSILTRYLSWALVPHGIIGFWGVPIDEGVVILNQEESQAEAIFIDVLNSTILSLDGKTQVRGLFTILRLDSTLHGRNIGMRREELFSFLTQYCTYFDYSGLSYPVRQLIQHLSRISTGIIYPRESFRPRTDLSIQESVG